MCIYEVNLQISNPILASYREWLNEHIQKILKLEGFLTAHLFLVQEPEPKTGTTQLCVQYQLRDQAALTRYLREDAPRLRAEGTQLFGDQFQATRRVLVHNPLLT